MKKIKISLMIVILNYLFLIVLSYLFTSKIELAFIGVWGLLAGFICLIGALPLYKILYFGGRGIAGTQSPQIPYDEHLDQKVHRQYEKEERDKSGKNRAYQDILTIAGIMIVLIAIFIL